METEAHLSGFFYFSNHNGSFLWEYVASWTLVAILTAILCLQSAAESAIFAVAHLYSGKPDKQLSKKGIKIQKLLENPDSLKIAFGIVNTFLRVALIILLVLNFFYLGNNTANPILLIAILAVVYVFVIEIIPKTIVNNKPEKFTISITGYLWAQYIITKPFSLMFNGFINWITKIINGSSAFSVGEISNAIEQASERLNEEEDILKGIVKFANIDVSQILKPRVDVVAIDISAPLDDVLKTVIESGYSRIPVYSKNFDDIKGILFVKDLMPYINEKNSFRWQTLIRKPYFVPDSKKVKELLTEFQTKKIHMAIIVDEYGGTIGIVTLEDILEEIVGEIADEADEDDKFYTQINDNTYLFDAKVLLNDFYKILHSEPTIFDAVKGDADTLAGLILELKGEIPEKNEEIEYKQFIFKIEAVDSRRIKQIRVTIQSPENNEKTT
ncbi:MAG TPA: gliding motility-associated protein GldE [Bacteroidales bacterium]|nr:gliding motility-associated protein GldE [Bacteroidales bacterium]